MQEMEFQFEDDDWDGTVLCKACDEHASMPCKECDWSFCFLHAGHECNEQYTMGFV